MSQNFDGKSPVFEFLGWKQKQGVPKVNFGRAIGGQCKN